MRTIAVALACLLAASTGSATGFHPVESIRAAALGALPEDTEAEATLDPALRLPQCDGELAATKNSTGSVEVSCPGGAGWRLFVPVKVRRSQQVLVLNRGVAAGQPIPGEALTVETRDAGRLVGAAAGDPALAIGKLARRTLMAGSVLLAGDLLSPRLVRRGDSVVLVSRRGTVEVRMAGKALGSAGEEERILVENVSSRRVVQGIVGADGNVWINR